MSVNQDLIVPSPRLERERPYSPPAPGTGDGATLMQIVERALREPTFDIDRIERMLALKERWDANERHKAFTEAMAAFKENPPKITKNKHVHFELRDNKGKTDFWHASHAEVTMKIIAGLAAVGISHRWIPSQIDGKVRIECVLTHRMGHSESTVLEAPPDISGTKSPIQAIASTSTLLQRYTLLAATGLSADDLPDHDDNKPGSGSRPELPLDVQVALEDAAKEGSEALAKTFKGLSEQTRARIVADYSTEWTQLKADAAKVKT